MASVPQQMQPNMVFAAAPQMTTQQPLLIPAQNMNGQMQYISGYPTTAGFVTQGSNQYMMPSYPMMMNAGPFQTTNQVSNLAIQIPQNNGQQLIATTPTQMMQQQPQQQQHPGQGQAQGKAGQKGQQLAGNQAGLMKAQVTANKSLHQGQQMQAGPQNGQPQQAIMQQPGTYYVTQGGQFVSGPAQPQPQQMPQQQQQQQNNKKNGNAKAHKQSVATPKPIQIQSPMLQQAQFKPGAGMQQGTIQQAPIQFANANGQQPMFQQMPMQIWNGQAVQQGQYVALPQQGALRSPQGEPVTMVLQPGQQAAYQTIPAGMQLAPQGQPNQPGTPTMLAGQQPVMQMATGTYAQVAPATTPTTPTKSVMIQPKIQPPEAITPKAPAKIPVKLMPNNNSVKAESPQTVKLTKIAANGPQNNSNVKSTGTNSSRSSFPSLNGPSPASNHLRQNVKSVTTGTNTQGTRTVNTQVSKKAGTEKRSQGTGSTPAHPNSIKKENKNDIIQHFVDGHIVLESKQPFPCEPEVESKTAITKVKPDPKGEQKENITVQLPVSATGKGKTSLPDKPDTKNKLPETKQRPIQNGVKFPPIASKPTPTLPPQPTPPTSIAPKVSTSKSVSTGTPTVAGNKRQATKPEAKIPEKKQAIAQPPPVPTPVVQPVAPVPVRPEPEVAANNDNMPDVWLPGNNRHPDQWSIDDVCDFISHIDGCTQYEADFRTQEIDGAALMLIRDKHLVEILKAKWGTALKIYKKIEDVKRFFGINNSN